MLHHSLKSASFGLLIAGSLLQAAALPVKEDVSAATIARIERDLTMPRGAAPLAEYHRLYGVVDIQLPSGEWRRVVRGLYVHSEAMEGAILGERLLRGVKYTSPAPGVYAFQRESGFPYVNDGGCTIVHVDWDASRERLISYDGEGWLGWLFRKRASCGPGMPVHMSK